MKKYEALFIFANTLTDEELDAQIGQIGNEIAKLGGKQQSATRMGRIPFARIIRKKETGAYVQILFDMDPGKIGALRERFLHKDELIRLQIVAARATAKTSAKRTAADAAKQAT